MGSCGAPAGIYWPGDVLLTYWGLTECAPPDTHPIVLPGGVRRSPRLERTPTRWISVDPDLVAVARAAYAPSQLHAPRQRVLFFRGSTREDKVEPKVAAVCLQPSRDAADKRCRDGLYSLGIRQTVRQRVGAHPLLRFNPNATYEKKRVWHAGTRAYVTKLQPVIPSYAPFPLQSAAGMPLCVTCDLPL